MKKGIKIFGICLMLSAVGFACSSKQARVAYALEDESSEIIEEPTDSSVISESIVEEPTIEEATEGSDIEKWAKEKWETFVAPLVGGISVTAILSFVSTLFINWLKNKKLDKKLLEIESKKVELENKIIAVETTLATLAIIKDEVGDVKTAVKSFLALSETKFNEIKEESVKLQKIEPILKLLIELEAKLAKTSQDAIKAGIVSDIKELERLVKEF